MKVDGPGQLAVKRFREGAERGRGGKGNVFVWASGNGGEHGDSCAAAGYPNSIYTFSVGSVSYVFSLWFFPSFLFSTLLQRVT